MTILIRLAVVLAVIAALALAAFYPSLTATRDESSKVDRRARQGLSDGDFRLPVLEVESRGRRADR